MKLLFLNVIYLFSFFSEKEIDIKYVRYLYHESPKNETIANQFFAFLEKQDVISNPLIKGYKGAAYMMQAKYNWSPYQKIKNFNSGKKLLEESINQNQQNIELRYLRLTLQSNVPEFLGYSKNKKEDKDFILSKLPNISDMDLKNKITLFMKSSNYLIENKN